MIQEYLEKGVIRPSISPYSNPIVLVRKKDGSLRFCIDYGRLNAVTKKDAYPVPDIDSILLTLGKPKYYAKLNVKDEYWHIPMEEESIEKTSFPTPDGLYEWVVMPFGLTNKVNKWAMLLKSLNLNVKYRQGKLNQNADALCRAFHPGNGQLDTTPAVIAIGTSVVQSLGPKRTSDYRLRSTGIRRGLPLHHQESPPS